MNDPNGLYYKDGVYHLFFQHYPDGNKWGPMHWGHATSKDLVKWEEHPIALYPDDLGYIFSGSAVVDKNNTSGFGDSKNNPVVAVYTYHNPNREKDGKIDVESGIAYSLDNSKTWTKYSSNPVLKIRESVIFVIQRYFGTAKDSNGLWFWLRTERTFTLQNLKEWTFQSEFGKDLGGHGGVWECPDLFPLKVEGTNEENGF
jgi:levanase/fructan beta-fructosidase